MARRARILLASDDGASTLAMASALTEAKHEVRICERDDSLASQVAVVRPDAVVLDLRAGDPETLPALVHRVHASYRPLLLCAVDHGSPQRLTALEAGADACIDKPYTADELVVHLAALLRRAPWLARRVHQVGDLVIDEEAHVAVYRDQLVELNAKEFGVLAMLAEHAGTVLSKPKLLEALWGYDAYDENLVEVHMSALRRRLPAEARAMLHTVRKVGYVLRDDEAQGHPA